jgi:hypothetical protein
VAGLGGPLGRKPKGLSGKLKKLCGQAIKFAGALTVQLSLWAENKFKFFLNSNWACHRQDKAGLGISL